MTSSQLHPPPVPKRIVWIITSWHKVEKVCEGERSDADFFWISMLSRYFWNTMAYTTFYILAKKYVLLVQPIFSNTAHFFCLYLMYELFCTREVFFLFCSFDLVCFRRLWFDFPVLTLAWLNLLLLPFVYSKLFPPFPSCPVPSCLSFLHNCDKLIPFKRGPTALYCWTHRVLMSTF